MILFSKINRFLSSTTHGSIRTDLIKKMNYNYKTRFKFYLFLYPLLILTRIPFKRRVYCPIENGDEVTIITLRSSTIPISALIGIHESSYLLNKLFLLFEVLRHFERLRQLYYI